MLIFLGKPAKNPFEGLFENFKPFDKNDKYPTLETVKSEWKKASALLRDAVHSVSEEHLAADSPLKSPIGDFTNGGTVAFLAQHESYDIGQIGFLNAIALEALLCTLRSIAAPVPAAIGVQEWGYAMLAPLFGMPPDMGVAVSLLKRAREIVLGVPALLYWQSVEGRKAFANV